MISYFLAPFLAPSGRLLVGYDRSGSVALEADTVHAVPPVVAIDDVVVVERAVDLGD